MHLNSFTRDCTPRAHRSLPSRRSVGALTGANSHHQILTRRMILAAPRMALSHTQGTHLSLPASTVSLCSTIPCTLIRAPASVLHPSSTHPIADRNGWLPLAWAMNPPGFPRNSELLLSRSHENIEQKSYNGNSLLSTAICWESRELALALVHHSNIEVDSENEDGRTALSLAASQGAIDIVKMLVGQRRANWLARDHAGRSALDWATHTGHGEVVQYLQSIQRRENANGKRAPAG